MFITPSPRPPAFLLKKNNHNNKLRCEEKAVKLFSQQTELAEVNVCVLQLRQKMERGV